MKWVMLVVIFVCLPIYSLEKKKCGKVHLSVMAKTNNIAIRWHFTCKNHPDTIILYKNETNDNSTSGNSTNNKYSDGDKNKNETLGTELKKIEVNGTKSGYVDSGVAVTFDEFPGNWNHNSTNKTTKDTCFPYHVVSLKKNVTVGKKCLSINPSWMAKFGKLRIGQMYIPGTYQSTGPEKQQNLDLWQQLTFGIRYFDIEVSLCNNTNANSTNSTDSTNSTAFSYYNAGNSNNNSNSTNATSASNTTLMEELKNVRKFLEKSKKEVVILDFRGFHNYNASTHECLVKNLSKIFTRMIATRKISIHRLGPRLNELWPRNRRVIIHYRDKKVVRKYPWLWGDILIKNGTSKSSKKLKEYIWKKAKDHHHKEVACTLLTVLKSNGTASNNSTNSTDSTNQSLVRGNLEESANVLGANLSVWLDKKNLQRYINIIEVAYFESTNIVEDAIFENSKKREIFS